MRTLLAASIFILLLTNLATGYLLRNALHDEDDLYDQLHTTKVEIYALSADNKRFIDDINDLTQQRDRLAEDVNKLYEVVQQCKRVLTQK